MKTVLTILCALVFAFPAFAVVKIDIIDNHDGTADIKYLTDYAVVSFAIEITVDSGAVITEQFNYHTESIVVIYGDGDTTPGIGTNSMPLEIYIGYPLGGEPPLSGRLCSIRVDKSCLGTIIPDVEHGGIVFKDITSAPIDLSGATGTPITIPEPATMGLLALGGIFLTRRKK